MKTYLVPMFAVVSAHDLDGAYQAAGTHAGLRGGKQDYLLQDDILAAVEIDPEWLKDNEPVTMLGFIEFPDNEIDAAASRFTHALDDNLPAGTIQGLDLLDYPESVKAGLIAAFKVPL